MSIKFLFVRVLLIYLMMNVSKSMERILTNLKISDYVHMSVEEMTVKLDFKFNALQIEYLRNQSDITSFRLTIRKFKSNETESILNKVFFIKNIAYQTKQTSVTSAIEHTHFSMHDERSVNVTYDFMDTLKSIQFNLKAHGLYILCIIFLNSNETIYLLRLPYENCFDIEVKRVDETLPESTDETRVLEAHIAYYKPLFIPIMYILCALVFLVIIVWKDIIVKIRNKKIMLQKNNSIMKLINNLNSTAGIQTNRFGFNRANEKSQDSDASHPMLSETGPQIVVQSVSHCDTNEMKKLESHADDDEHKEATHILDMKPWKESENSSPLADSRKKLNMSMGKISSNRDLAVHRNKATTLSTLPVREQVLSRSLSYGSEERLQRKREFRNYRATHSTEFLSIDHYSPVQKPTFSVPSENEDELKSPKNRSINTVSAKRSNVCYFYESNV